MKLALTAAAALITLSIAGVASATPSLSYATPPAEVAGAEFIDAKFKFKKFSHGRGFNRGHFGKRFGHRSFSGAKYGHFGKGAFVKKGHGGKKVLFGKGLFFK